MKKYFNTPHLNEFAPWINILINSFKNRDGIELHVVAPNVFTKRQKDFTLNNVYYHFYKYKPRFIPNKLFRIFKIDLITNYFYSKKQVNSIIKKLNPDLIHLHGAENPYYSAAILSLYHFYPTLVSIQGFVRNTSIHNSITKKRIKIEEKIIKNGEHFGVCTGEMIEIIKKINHNPKFHHHDYPVTIPNIIKNNDNLFEPIDCLFFAKVCKDKGIEDLLEAISIIKQKNNDINLTVIGGASRDYLDFLNIKCRQLNIENNVIFVGFLETQHEIYDYAIKSKICVLPTHHDAIPGTIIESMFLKLPVISYAVGGIPALNKTDENVAVVDKGNIKMLSEVIYDYLNNPQKRKNLADNAYEYVVKEFSNHKKYENLLSIYNNILSE